MIICSNKEKRNAGEGAVVIQGEQGPKGIAATITVGSVTTIEPGENARVTNTGDENDAVLNFYIPKGATGNQGQRGPAPSLSVGTVTTLEAGEDATASITQAGDGLQLNLGLPKGETGETEIFVVTASAEDDGSFTTNKTFAEVKAAYQAGQTVIANIEGTLLGVVSVITSAITFAGLMTGTAAPRMMQGTMRSSAPSAMTVAYAPLVKTVNSTAPDGSGNVTLESQGVSTETFENYQQTVQGELERIENAIPDELPNPYSLTFTGAVSAEYDGSGHVTVNIPQGGGGGGGTAAVEWVHFYGMSDCFMYCDKSGDEIAAMLEQGKTVMGYGTPGGGGALDIRRYFVPTRIKHPDASSTAYYVVFVTSEPNDENARTVFLTVTNEAEGNKYVCQRLTIEGSGGGGGASDAGSVSYDSTASYNNGTVGKELQSINSNKVSVAQGSAHAGEFLVVGSDGNVKTSALETWQGGSY